MTNIRLIHIADIHLGYTGNKSLVFGEDETHAGRYVREVDIEQAVRRLTKSLEQADPAVDVVVIAGDLFHSPVPSPRAIATATRMVTRLIKKKIDVVVVDGNHDTPKVIHTGSPSTFLKEFSRGIHIVNGTEYKVIQDNQWLNPNLWGGLVVHCLPYRCVENGHFTGATPHSGHLNVLVAHGRVGNMPDLNSMGHSAGRIPPDILRRGWDYVALGDWHVPCYQPLKDVPAYYAGSLEALNFSEAEKYPPDSKAHNTIRGAIDVRLRENGEPTIGRLPNNEQRPLLRLKVIDAADLDADDLMNKFRQRLDAQLPSNALVLLEVRNCPREIWGQLDHEELKTLREKVRVCSIRPNFVRTTVGQSSVAASQVTLDEQWQQFLKEVVPDKEAQQWLMQEGLARIETARWELSQQDVD